LTAIIISQRNFFVNPFLKNISVIFEGFFSYIYNPHLIFFYSLFYYFIEKTKFMCYNI